MKLGSFMVKPAVLTEDRVLTDSDAGKTYFLNSTSGLDVTLPAPRAGVEFTFFLKATPSGETSDYTIGAKDDAKIIIGQVITSNIKSATDAEFERSGASQLKFLTPDARVGDSVDFKSDGTYWYATAFCSSYSAIVIAEQSKSSSVSSSISPSASPSISPSKSPSTSPSTSPSRSPSVSPSVSPSISPSTST